MESPLKNINCSTPFKKKETGIKYFLFQTTSTNEIQKEPRFPLLANKSNTKMEAWFLLETFVLDSPNFYLCKKTSIYMSS